MLGLFVFALVLLIPESPYFHPYPGVDSSVFIYIAKRVLAGAVPYKDAWDHKGPLLYFIDALGLLMARNSIWGIWAEQVMLLTLSFWIGFFSMSNFFSRLAALGGILISFSLYPALGGGNNFSEEFSIFPMFLAIYLCIKAIHSPPSLWPYFFIGMACGASFLIRANNVGIFVAIFLVLFWNALKTSSTYVFIKLIASAMLGFFAINMVLLLFFAYHNAVWDYFSAAYYYNFIYVSESSAPLQGIYLGLGYIEILAPTLFLSFALLLADLNKSNKKSPKTQFKTIVLLALPVDLLLALKFGQRGFPHYYLTWLPAISLVCAYFIDWLQTHLDNEAIRWKYFRVSLANLAISFFVFAALLLPGRASLPKALDFFQQMISKNGIARLANDTDELDIGAVTKYFSLHSETAENPYLIVWGDGVIFNLAFNKISPTRYIYLFPLATPGYTSQEMSSEFLDAIRIYRPIILEVGGYVPPIGDAFWNGMPGMEAVNDYILEGYTLRRNFGTTNYNLYIPNSD